MKKNKTHGVFIKISYSKYCNTILKVDGYYRGNLHHTNQWKDYNWCAKGPLKSVIAVIFHFIVLTKTRIGSGHVARNKVFILAKSMYNLIVIVGNTRIQILIRLSKYCAWVFHSCDNLSMTMLKIWRLSCPSWRLFNDKFDTSFRSFIQ